MSAAARTTRQPAARAPSECLSERQRVALFAQARVLAGGDARDLISQAVAGYPCRTIAPETATPKQRAGWPTPGAPCQSARHLSRAQARSLITRWGIDGAPIGRPYSAPRPRNAGDRISSLPTPAQRALIERLRAEIVWQYQDGFERWIAGRFSPVKGGRVRSFSDAERLIEALRVLRDRQEQVRDDGGRADAHPAR